MDVEYLSDVLTLSSEKYDQVENDHASAPDKVFDVDPENLTAVPGIKDVVD